MLWIVLVIVLAIYITIKTYTNVNYWKLRGVKHVRAWPVVGSFAGSVFRLKSFVEKIQDVYEKYPEARFVGFNQLIRPTLMVRDPEMIKQVFVKCFDNFSDHSMGFTEDMEPLFGKNLLCLKGQSWKDMRSTLSPAFTSSKMRKMYILIKECADQYTQHFLDLEKEKGTLEIEMLDVFSKFTNDVIATTAFGITCNAFQDDTNEFYTIGKEISSPTMKRSLRATMKFMMLTMMPKLMKKLGITLFSPKVSSFFRNIIKSTIETREKNNIIRPDMIHLLMEARKGRLKHETEKDDDAGFATVEESHLGKEQKTKPILTDDDITAQAILFFIAGYDTTSTQMHFLAHELAINPDIQKKLQSEIDLTLQNCSGQLDYDSLLKMKYLDMVVSESLRKYPPAPFSERICTIPYKFVDDDQVLFLEKGQTIWMPVYSLHHDEKYFPNPEKFDPERFSDENKANIAPFTYLPFGAGPRNCIGSRFALLEIKTIMTSILSKFDIVVIGKTQIPLKFKCKFPFTMTSENGVWLGFKRRS